jgi:hypothetical protein
MSALIFPPETAFRRLVLEPDVSACPTCGGAVWISSQRRRRFYTLDAPIDLHLKLARCKASACPGSLHFLNPLLEMQLLAYRNAREPAGQRDARLRNTLGRHARSTQGRPHLLIALERQFRGPSE